MLPRSSLLEQVLDVMHDEVLLPLRRMRRPRPALPLKLPAEVRPQCVGWILAEALTGHERLFGSGDAAEQCRVGGQTVVIDPLDEPAQ